MDANSFRTTITGCARCGQEHKNILVAKFGRPAGQYQWWAICPNTGEPIMIEIIRKRDESGDPRQTRPL
jgi:hypothetical protein